MKSKGWQAVLRQSLEPLYFLYCVVCLLVCLLKQSYLLLNFKKEH